VGDGGQIQYDLKYNCWSLHTHTHNMKRRYTNGDEFSFLKLFIDAISAAGVILHRMMYSGKILINLLGWT
jgi:hypothetical protein